ASFSTYLRYSSSVVAPMQCSSPRASAGFSMLPASIEPSALPAPTMVCSSSMKRMIWPSFLARSFSTAFSRSSNSPRNLAPAISAPMSSDSTRLPRRPSGTSPLTMRWARPSAIAVLPTPGPPISTGLFLVRRCSTWMVRRISSSRPITGSSLPISLRAVRSMVYFSSAWRASSALASSTFSPPRMASIAASSRALSAPAAFSARPASPPSSSAASRNSSEAMKASPRCCASLSVWLSRRPRSLPSETWPAWPETFGSFSRISPRRSRSRGTLTPDCASSGPLPPPCWSSNAASTWAGSIRLWSRPTASDCASASACWKREVSLSIRMVMPRCRGRPCRQYHRDAAPHAPIQANRSRPLPPLAGEDARRADGGEACEGRSPRQSRGVAPIPRCAGTSPASGGRVPAVQGAAAGLPTLFPRVRGKMPEGQMGAKLAGPSRPVGPQWGMAAETHALPPPPPIDDSCALFLDVDGTLLDFAPSPDEVSVPDHLREALRALHARLGGAVALVSGRSLATLDALLAPQVMPAAGLHGLERRHGRRGHRAPRPPTALALVRSEAEQVAARHPGAIVEDKGAALALHWRAAPHASGELQAFAIAALPRLPGYRLQPGNDVLELRPAEHKGGRADKGAAILAFMGEAPFAGRRPVFAGDDITDEAGFAAVNARDGVSVLVGPPRASAAHYALADPAAVHAWIGARR